MKRSAAEVAEVPFGVVTVTSTIPMPAGEVAVMDVGLCTTTWVAALEPNFTAVAPVNPVPMMVTLVPPNTLPNLGWTALTVGAAAAT